jgi:hypothetical protein
LVLPDNEPPAFAEPLVEVPVVPLDMPPLAAEEPFPLTLAPPQAPWPRESVALGAPRVLPRAVRLVEEASWPDAPALEAPGWVADPGVVIVPEPLPVDPLCALDGVPASGQGVVWFAPPDIDPLVVVFELPLLPVD